MVVGSDGRYSSFNAKKDVLNGNARGVKQCNLIEADAVPATSLSVSGVHSITRSYKM